mgnify:CR=1 FL=1
MLSINQTYNQKKAFLLDYIKTSRQLLKVINDIIKQYPSLADVCIPAIEKEQLEIAETMNELVQLNKWFKKEGIRPDEPYIPRKIREERSKWTEKQWQEYEEQQLEIEAKLEKLNRGIYE